MRPPVGATGFSLIEMMVVVAVVSVLAVGASLPLARAGASAASDGVALEAAAARVRALAMVSGRPHALVVTAEGWTAERRVGGGWEPVAAPERFVVSRLSGAARLLVLPDGRTGALRLSLDGGIVCAAGPGPLACGPG